MRTPNLSNYGLLFEYSGGSHRYKRLQYFGENPPVRCERGGKLTKLKVHHSLTSLDSHGLQS